MTNTLHRYGKAETFRDDYIIFALPSKGKNDHGAIEKLKTFLGICVRHRPANIGASGKSSFRPSTSLNPSVHWKRDLEPDFGVVIDGVKRAGTVGAVFDSREKAEACLREVVDADLGLSINISTSVEGAKNVGNACGVPRHSVEYSLGATRTTTFQARCVVMGWSRSTWSRKWSTWSGRVAGHRRKLWRR